MRPVSSPQCKFIIHKFAPTIPKPGTRIGELDESLIRQYLFFGGWAALDQTPGLNDQGADRRKRTAIKTKQAAIPLYACLPCLPINKFPQPQTCQNQKPVPLFVPKFSIAQFKLKV
jgi:hypothetical protein